MVHAKTGGGDASGAKEDSISIKIISALSIFVDKIRVEETGSAPSLRRTIWALARAIIISDREELGYLDPFNICLIDR
jgi:hypothetical protein